MWKIKEWFLHYKEAIRVSLLALFRWTLLAVCTGVLCGGIGTLFHLAVEWVTEQRAEQVWLLWLRLRQALPLRLCIRRQAVSARAPTMCCGPCRTAAR